MIRIFSVSLLVLFATISRLEAQCEFAIAHTNTNDHCLYAEEEVVWKNPVNVTVTSNSVVKSSGLYDWNSGAISINTVKANGWSSTVVSETNTNRFFGLSPASAAAPGFNRPRFGIYLQDNGTMAIWENGNYRINPSGHYGNMTYRAGDVMKIAVEDGLIKYYQNTTLLYISGVPTLPLHVDVVLYSPASSIRNVKVGNGSDGSFSVSIANPGTGATYQWYLNGVPDGTGTTYTNTSLNSAHTLTCKLTTGTGGCAPSGTVIDSNPITFSTVSISSFADYHVTNDSEPFACYAAQEPVIFSNVVNMETTGNNITKTLGNNGFWDAGFFSVNSVVNNGYFEVVIPQNDKGIFIGLSSTNTGLNSFIVQYGFFLRGDRGLQVYEGNSPKYTAPSIYNAGEKLRIEVDNNVIKYYHKDLLVYTSLATPTLPLYVHGVFSDLSGSLQDLTITNGTSGKFDVIGNAFGPSPSFQWKINGADAGTDSNTLTVSDMNNNDVITCIIDTDLTGCSAVVTSDLSLSTLSTFKGTSYIKATSTSVACVMVEEEVIFADMANTATAGNNITKNLGTNGFWDAGATSLNLINDNGYASVVVNDKTKSMVFGLSSNARPETHNSNANTSIQYGISFRGDGNFEVWELVGTTYTPRGGFGGHNDGDRFKIKVENGVVRYYRNDSPFYSSPMNPSSLLPLVVDVAFNSASARMDDIRVSNGNNNTFQAVTAHMGTSPTYQWKINGVDTGPNSPTFATSSLNEGDKITCYVTPDIGGCSALGFLTNTIHVSTVGGAVPVTTTWTGNTSTSWKEASNWSNGVPTGFMNVEIPSGRPRNPTVDMPQAGVFDLTIQSGATLNMSSPNELVVFNNWVNSGTFTANTSTVSFKGCTTNKNTITASAFERFSKMKFDNTNGIEYKGTIRIANELAFVNGIATPADPSALIVFENGSSTSGASDASHVEGKVRKVGLGAFTFPIGKINLHRSLTMSSPANATDYFTAEYFKGNPATDPAYGTDTHSGFWTISGCEYWTLERSGTSTVNVQLTWNRLTNCDTPPYITDLDDLRVTFWDGSIWNNGGTAGTTGDNDNGSIWSSIPSTAYHAFTLASVSAANTLPIVLGDFTGVQTATGVLLEWNTRSESNASHFSIERAGQDIVFTEVGSVNATGESKEENKYSFVDRSASQGKNYYRLKFIDLDGTHTYSQVIVLENIQKENYLFPNPVRQGGGLHFTSPCNNCTVVEGVSKNLVRTLNGETEMETSSLKQGMYILRDSTGAHHKFIVY